jgi:sulfate transport system permease protein
MSVIDAGQVRVVYERQTARRTVNQDRAVVRWAIVSIAVLFMAIFVVLPLIAVFAQALSRGFSAYFAALIEPDALSAIRLTLLIAFISVTVNLVFGLVAAWAIAKFEFPGKSLLVTLIDLPFSVSPVVSGLVFVLLFGAQGLLGPWLIAHGVQIIFAVPPLSASRCRM